MKIFESELHHCIDLSLAYEIEKFTREIISGPVKKI